MVIRPSIVAIPVSLRLKPQRVHTRCPIETGGEEARRRQAEWETEWEATETRLAEDARRRWREQRAQCGRAEREPHLLRYRRLMQAAEAPRSSTVPLMHTYDQCAPPLLRLG